MNILFDPEDLDGYRSQIQSISKASKEKMGLHIGYSFSIIPQQPPVPVQADQSGYRPLPHLPFGIETTFTLSKQLQNGENRFSEVWLAQVPTVSSAMTSVTVVLKFFIPSKLPLPTTESVDLKLYRTPQELVGCQYEAYMKLEEYQGKDIPYCFGKFRVNLPWDEESDVLVLEYIPRKFSDIILDDDCAAFKRLEDPEVYFALFMSTLKFIETAHRLVIYHLDIAERNALFDEINIRVVFIDWHNDVKVDFSGYAEERAPFTDLYTLTKLFYRCIIVEGSLEERLKRDGLLWRRLAECGGVYDPDINTFS
ncbi:hypothetical protein VNI00_010276 [Paramarasmius palmivorus]|uniref:Protein kinase domain-containing protein n=1 Tax=Paramarasmius palmivorus TaxID=297713 RepID=A0AAW0CH87_9AGAR